MESAPQGIESCRGKRDGVPERLLLSGGLLPLAKVRLVALSAPRFEVPRGRTRRDSGYSTPQCYRTIASFLTALWSGASRRTK